MTFFSCGHLKLKKKTTSFFYDKVRKGFVLFSPTTNCIVDIYLFTLDIYILIELNTLSDFVPFSF